jgi:hypothetical protein
VNGSSARQYAKNAEALGSREADEAQALRTRELSLPAELRATNPKVRDLRDAYLGVMRLSNPLEVPLEPNPVRALVMIAHRSNARAQLQGIAKKLEQEVKEEDRTWAKQAAKSLFSWTVQQQRISQAR